MLNDTQFSTYVAYNLNLENNLLYDEYASVPTNVVLPEPKILLSCSPHVNFPASPESVMTPPSLYLPSAKDRDDDKDKDPFHSTEQEDDDQMNPFLLLADDQFHRTEAVIQTPKKSKTSTVVDIVTTVNPYEHQRILYLHSLCCVTTSKQCVPFEPHLLDYYSKVSRFFISRLERRHFGRIPGRILLQSTTQM